MPLADRQATAGTNDATFNISGTATSTCLTTSGDFNACDFGTTTTTDAIGVTDTCTGTCPTTQGTVRIQYGFVKFPPNPCHATKLTGTLTLDYPTDPTYAPSPILVNLTGHLIDSHAVTFAGTLSAQFGLWPPSPIRVTVATAFPTEPLPKRCGHLQRPHRHRLSARRDLEHAHLDGATQPSDHDPILRRA